MTLGLGASSVLVEPQRQFGQPDFSFFPVSGLINTDNCSLIPEEPSHSLLG